MVEEELIALLQRMQQPENERSFRQIAKRAGIKSAESLARVWRREGRLGPESARLLAIAYGEKYGFSEDDLRRWSGLPLRDQGGPSRAGPSVRGPAPPHFTVVQARGNVEPATWILKQIPVVRQLLHAGWMEPVEPEQPLLVSVPRDSNYLAMRITGECMEPEASPGDFAIVDCDASPRVGEAVVVEVDGEQSLRYLAEQTTTRWVLTAENDGFSDIVTSPDKARILGVIVAYQRVPKRLRPKVRKRTG